jgi:hypothetical protein
VCWLPRRRRGAGGEQEERGTQRAGRSDHHVSCVVSCSGVPAPVWTAPSPPPPP